VLDPWPTTLQILKFGVREGAVPRQSGECQLKRSLLEFFDYVRGVEEGQIRNLEIRHGLPFSMEIERRISREVPDVEEEHVGAV
jgi:hypothetical protein